MRELEAKREQTPSKVFARVHADYTNRLNAVAEQLRQHAKSMQQHAGNLMAKLRELEATSKKLEDDLAESQIRRQVGELSANEFDSFSKKAQREIARLEDDQERIADDLNRIRHMLGGRRASADEEEDRPRTSQDFDELEFLQSVVGTNTPAAMPVPRATPSSAPQAPTIARPAAPAPAPSATSGPVKTLPPQPAPAPSATSGPVKTLPPQPALPPVLTQPIGAQLMGNQPETPEAPAQRPSSPLSGAEPRQPTPPDGPLAIRASGALEQPKTLKCAECGSMNFPSEWYCERCGAELAAI